MNMGASLYDRLWRRECGQHSAHGSLRGIYGAKEWIEDLDIVNELGGHTECVNALRYVFNRFPFAIIILSVSYYILLPSSRGERSVTCLISHAQAFALEKRRKT